MGAVQQAPRLLNDPWCQCQVAGSAHMLCRTSKLNHFASRHGGSPRSWSREMHRIQLSMAAFFARETLSNTQA